MSLFAKRMLLVMFLLTVFVMVVSPSLDPDLGWHLAAGKLMIERHDVPRTDWFSFTMPDYPWVDHEWLSDVASYVIYNAGGIIALSVVFAIILVGACMLLLALLPKHADMRWRMLAVLGSIWMSRVILSAIGARTQIISVFFLLLVFFLLVRFRAQKYSARTLLIALPLIFCAWANLHGGFFLGLGFVGLFLFGEFTRRIIAVRMKPAAGESSILSFGDMGKGAIALVLAAAATLVNPYTYGIYREVFTTLSDPLTARYIAEWQSPNFHEGLGIFLIGYAIALFALLIFSRKAKDLTLILIAFVFFVFAIQANRHVPLFMFLTLPLFVDHFAQGMGEGFFRAVPRGRQMLTVFLVCTLLILAPFQAYNLVVGSFSDDTYAAQGKFPVYMAQFLKTHPVSGPVLNTYHWGGYLLWQGVIDKTFVDGRMPHWRQGDRCAFCDYLTIVTVYPNWKQLLAEYGIHTVIVEAQSPLAGALLVDPGWKIFAWDLQGVTFVERDANEQK